VDEQPYEEVEWAVAKLLAALGIEQDAHVADTPRRVAKAWRDQLWGLHEDPSHHLSVTFPGPEDSGLVIQAGIDVQSTCAHHLLPFGGHGTVAYRPFPGQDIVGLSKLTRVVYGYSARLQVQERIGFQVVDAIMGKLKPQGAICLLTCEHDCIKLRGVRSPSSQTTTVSQRGGLSDADVALVHQLHARKY
jgi:GTP cyclohydrolase I